MQIQGLLEAPRRPGVYELRVLLKEVPAHGDDSEIFCTRHVIYAERIEVDGEEVPPRQPKK